MLAYHFLDYNMLLLGRIQVMQISQPFLIRFSLIIPIPKKQPQQATPIIITIQIKIKKKHKKMLQKTSTTPPIPQPSPKNSDQGSQSTKMESIKAASFTSPAKRHMYRNKALSSIMKVEMEVCNMIIMVPQYLSYLVLDQVFFLEAGTGFVGVGDFYYGVVCDRAKPVMIPRNCQPGSEILFANAKKPGMNIILSSVHRFSNLDYPCMLHFNITKYNPAEPNSTQARDVYIPYSQNQTPAFFVTVQNSKKGILLSQSTSPQPQYQLLYISLTKPNKQKNPKHISMHKKHTFSLSLSFSNNEDDLPQPSPQQKQYIYSTPQKFVQKVKLQPGEQVLNMINSEFGDSVVLVTNRDVYQMEVDVGGIGLKGLEVITKLGKYLKKEDYQDQIKDVCYITDGLKIIFLTKKGQIGILQAQNIQFAQSVPQILSNSNKKEQGDFMRVYSLMGKISVQTDKGIVLIFKIGDRQLVFEKRIQLPVHLQGSQAGSYKINFLVRHDQLILQRVTKQARPVLQVLSKNLLSPSNQFSQIYCSPIQQTPPKQTLPAPKILPSKSTPITCILFDHTVSFHRHQPSTFSPTSPSSSPLQHLFSKTFFQKPISISMDPYCSNVIIVFKEFVKFYKFKFNDLVQFFTYDVRNVGYAGFVEDGRYVLIAVQDFVYFINAFTFQLHRVMEAYGDIKSIRYYDNILYILLKNKVNKNTTQTLILQTYMHHNNEYKKIHQLKVQPTESILTDKKFLIHASKTHLQVYSKKPQIYTQPTPTTTPTLPHHNTDPQLQLLITKKIQLREWNQYPTCVTLCEEFGIVLVGTNCGRIYQYLWPLQEGEPGVEDCYVLHCATSEIVRIVLTATLDRIYVYCRNLAVLQMELIQYVQGEQMSNIYVINPKTLYNSQPLKHQFINREYLYPTSTPYIYEDIRQTDQNIQQLKFILQKTKDDIQELVTKNTETYQQEINKINQEKSMEVRKIKEEMARNQVRFSQESFLVRGCLEENLGKFQDQVKMEKEKYEKTLLQLYKEATKLRETYANLEKQQIREKDLYLIENDKMMRKLREEGELVQQQYKQKYRQIKQKTDLFNFLQKQQITKKIEEELQAFNQIIRNNTLQQLNAEQQRKESLLGSKGYLMKQITNYKQRRDEFQSLIMQTKVQIQELYSDQELYGEKRRYLMTQLGKKERIIQEKERELMGLIDSTANMKKLKQTHQFQLSQYEKEFEPIISKMTIIEGKVQKMNSEILREYLKKVEKDKEIMENAQKFQKLKKQRQKKIRIKLDTQTKVQRFLAQLQTLLQNPLDKNLQQSLNSLSNGQKYEIDEQQVKQKLKNAKLMRRKQFIGKQIEQHEKRQQQIIRNKNDINRHYNQNTMLVREFNNLKQLNRKFQELFKQTQLKYIAAKASRLETPRKKTNSMMDLKKFSQKKLTPFQKHQQQYNEMFKKGATTETKLSKTGGQSMSLLKSLIKDVQLTDSRYEKMEIVRDRIKTFVNPQIRIRKTLATQRALFQRSKRPEFQAEM